MADLLFDTTILIDLFRNDPRVDRYLEGLLDETGLVTHAMVKAEVLVGLGDSRELGKFDRLFRRFELVHATQGDSEEALAWLRRLHLSHKVGFPDCLIAATAIRMDLPVVTLNLRHFRLFKGLRVVRPYCGGRVGHAPRCGGAKTSGLMAGLCARAGRVYSRFRSDLGPDWCYEFSR